MAEKNLNFDIIIDRKNTNSLKYDFAKERGKSEDLIPLWVADMDFKVSSYVQEAIQRQSVHGIFGYSEAQNQYFDVLKQWMQKHYDFYIEKEWVVKTPGIVFAMAMAIQAFSHKGDAILIQDPVYYCFREIIESNDRRLINNTLLQNEEGRYIIDFHDFEQKIINENVKIFLLCNPHNPTGRSWTKEELEIMGDICLKHNVLVISDEIHADFVFKGKHTVFATVKEEYKNNSIICTSPSKTFNISGFQISNIFIPNERLRKAFVKQLDKAGYSQLNTVGLTACQAAYQDGEEWYNAVYQYIKENIDYCKKYLEENIPQVKLVEPDATFLLWLDFRELGLSLDELEDLIVNKAKLWLDKGTMFGQSGAGFERINIAVPREVLTTALESLKNAVQSL